MIKNFDSMKTGMISQSQQQKVAVRERVKQLFEGRYIAAHDFKHVERVAGLAKKIAAGEGYDVNKAEVAGLLHDLGRMVQEEEEGHDEAGGQMAQDILEGLSSYDPASIGEIISAIRQHGRFKSEGDLAHILQDADKLDGLGAIGLVRAYISKSHLLDYREGEVMVGHGTRNAQTISEQIAFQMEWYEMLYTETAKTIAKERFEFMQIFMKELEREVEESK